MIRIGVLVMHANGPFVGDDPRTAAWNWAYRHGPWMATTGAAYAAALAAYGLCAGPLGRGRVFGYRGPTRCGRCGYALHGLREPRCPECGTAM